ncbi:TPA_exp: Uncharacterized protein A8136_6294 [Trichophyton benhamiae CBS 112371]|uniref:Uncharacterized protein n=1 Tax=Arthroderma benhamiae (strain ATCC MYA-4681 / CBS 112371) TaxID=663331 RepID=D4AQT8_ARTBC|nr:uncharacterized protein ARB_06598 [Trichophyton benhamiae CBS 112371]EFE34832.1 conserved hypothetical protein [Trichophyton benhamiae CBS 112371]DAA77748.1 TPA_exp: Uncharacterized protein A8136_6294 [Trichophyton benhamiae CBS 112371]
MYSFRYYIDSWIELSSQPSSSSLSSAATTDDIITTGLRVQQLRRRRATHHHHHNHNHRAGYHVPPQDLEIGYSHRSSSTTGSSQDENEETESESDRLSNDDFPTRLQPDMNMLPEISSQSDGTLSTDDDEDDEDDTSTALGFNPQPNAFSHPPASIRTGQSGNSLDSARLSQNRRNSRSSLPGMGSRRSSVQHSPFNMISPSHQADHDAALRASLSTLLSCAAAARGLPKNDSQPSVAERSPPRAEPSTFRLLPGANDTEEPFARQMHAPPPPASAPSRFQPSTSPSPSPKRSRSPISTTAQGKARRRASPSKDRASTKKAGRAMLSSSSSSLSSETATSNSSYRSISPTVMTWVISAGVVVLFSAISFSAGYVLGREVGRVESGQALYGNGLSNVSEPATSSFATLKSGSGCGREAVRGGLGRFRWTGGSVSA